MAKRKVVVSEEDIDRDGIDTSPSNFNDLLIDKLKSDLGGNVYILGRDHTPADVKEYLSTGSTVLDMCVTNNLEVKGGIPVGRLTSISGDPSTGKSLLAYQILKDCANKGGISVLIDTENAANFTFLRMLGLDPEKNLIYVQVDTVEDVFEAIESVIKKVREEDKNRLVTIVWDSVASTSTRKEMEEDVGDAQVALVPRLLGQGLRKTIRMIGNQRICLIFLNQLRAKIGNVWGDPTTEPGGNAVPFFADVRIKLFTAGKIKAGDDVIGVGTRAHVLKTRFGPPYRNAKLSIYFTKGLVDEDDWLDYLKNKDLAKKLTAQKSSIEFNGETLDFKNRDFVQFVKKNDELKSYIQGIIRKDLYIEQDPDKREEELKFVEDVGEKV